MSELNPDASVGSAEIGRLTPVDRALSKDNNELSPERLDGRRCRDTRCNNISSHKTGKVRQEQPVSNQ